MTPADLADAIAARRRLWLAIFAASSAIIVGIGLQRFAYTPLIPALITEKWFLPAEVAYLGAANFAGYLVGALTGRMLAARLGARLVLRGAMFFAVVILLASSEPLSFAWFFGWRLASGIVGGVLMVLAAPLVLAHVPPERRGIMSGVIFGGVGLGIIASGTVVPLLLRIGLSETWYGLGVVALVFAIASWPGWPPEIHQPPPPSDGATARVGGRRDLVALYIAYGLNAVGLVPHMVFLVDFVARGLYQGLEVGAGYWVLFGIGALFGPVATGALGDLVGFRRAFHISFVLQAIAIAVLTFAGGTILVGFSSLVIGAFVPGVVPLALGRVQELLPDDAAGRARAWSYCTTAFAIGQAGGAYFFSFIFSQSQWFASNHGAYAMLFALGAATMLAALASDILGSRLARAGS